MRGELSPSLLSLGELSPLTIAVAMSLVYAITARLGRQYTRTLHSTSHCAVGGT
jgi:hypothetical protein